MRKVLLLLILIPQVVVSQRNTSFWEVLDSKADPQAIHFDIAIDPASDEIHVATDHGLYKSGPEGDNWQKLSAPTMAFFQIRISGQYRYAVAAQGAIYHSQDGGDTWAESQLPDTQEIRDLEVLPNGDVVAATGHILEKNQVGYFRGNGLLRSVDHGATWQKLDIGSFNNRYIAQLAQDSHGNLFASVNEYNAQDGALIYSVDGGLSWRKIPNPTFLGGGNELLTTNVVQVTSLEVDHTDRIHVSLQGGIGSMATALNLTNSLTGALDNGEWSHLKLTPYGYEWFYNEGYDLFFAENGDIYAPRLGFSFRLSSIFYLDHEQEHFERMPLDPVMINDAPYFNFCRFAQRKDGRVFAVQQLDGQVYYTDHSRKPEPVLGVEDPKSLQVLIYPNPAQDRLKLVLPETQGKAEVVVYDFAGRMVEHYERFEHQTLDLDVRVWPRGLYTVQVQIDGTSEWKKLLLR
ncbi:MAG: T9SS type A sorting domain-containing protein [Marinoscillum sp.]|uniref:T9SS type A sorting domain-containing protein n=1 Tax=Marinoscillum sp. TaxID=2024838 RepID=UPI0032F1A753